MPVQGMNTDSNNLFSNKDTYLFALNAINESENGDLGLIGNENSNEAVTYIKPEYTVLGHVYMGDGQTCVFSVRNDNTMSEIGILENDQYKTVVESSELNFNINNQIEAVYRLRKGCNKTVYWVDGLNKPRKFDFQDQDSYKNIYGNWLPNKFNLQKQSITIPQFNSIDVIEAGELYPGAYQIGIQYIDDNNNATEWMNISKKIIIYNDSFYLPYESIHGSIHQEDVPSLNFPRTNKAIKVSIKNFDPEYKYLRLCIIGFHNGTGTLSGIYVTDKFSTSFPEFTFTGSNYAYTINQEELIKFQNIILTAKHIDQIDNKLILANITNKQVEWCKFQKYASLIQADCVVKKIDMDTLHKEENDLKNYDNPKHPNVYFNGGGYMPGEIYSFGIIYILADGTFSPVFHIPGKSPDDAPDKIFSAGDDVYPMDNTDNQIQMRYDEKESCSSTNYWGKDYNGKRIGEETFVRHHRFPTRKAIGKPHIEYGEDGTITVTSSVNISVKGKYFLDVECPPIEEPEEPENPDIDPDEGDPIDEEEPVVDDCEPIIRPKLSFRISYLVDGNVETEEFTSLITGSPIEGSNYEDGAVKEINQEFSLNHVFEEAINEDDLKIEVQFGEDWIDWDEYLNGAYADHWEEKPTLTTSVTQQSSINNHIYSNIFGIKFSNIIMPSKNDVKDDVVGYYIVQQERTNDQKTILDSGLMIPTLKADHFIAAGLLAPSGGEAYEKLSKNTFALICPSNLFENKEYDNSVVIEQQGVFNCQPYSYTYNTYNNVTDQGSTWEQIKDNEDVDRDWSYDDKEGIDYYSATVFLRDRQLLYETVEDGIKIESTDLLGITSLAPFDSIKLLNSQYIGYNMIQNQSCLFVQLSKNLDYDWNLSEFKVENNFDLKDKGQITLPYVIIRRKLYNCYSNFQTAPYYQTTNNYNTFDSTNETVSVFNGSIFNSAIRFSSDIYLGDKAAPIGARKKGFWEKAFGYIIGIGSILAGAALAIFTGGGSLALSVAGGAILAGAGSIILTKSKQVKYGNMVRALSEDYNNGLRDTITDEFVDKYVLANNQTYYKKDFEKIKAIVEQTVEELDERDDELNPPDPGTAVITGPDEFEGGLLWRQFNKAVSAAQIASYKSEMDKYRKRSSGIPYTDDTFIIVNDTLTSIWFESEYNSFLRTDMADQTAVVLFPENYEPLPPRKFTTIGLPNQSPEWNYFGGARVIFADTVGLTNLEKYVHDSLFHIDPEKGSSVFMPIPLPEFYYINPDYIQYKVYQKYFMLPSEYDCCSECKEKFPHRWMWSENSYDEETSDSYSLFKPNNYKDIPGDTGEITNVIVYNQNLFIHTQECFWMQPRAYQERVSDEIVTYIGTGEYGNLPPRKIVNDQTGMSAGLEHKWGSILTRNGYFFVSYNDRSVYLYNGQLRSISNNAMRKWFEDHIEIESTFTKDNPSSIFGSGFIWGYDPNHERMLLTKHDSAFKVETGANYEIANNYIFYNFKENKQAKLNDGWIFDGFVNKSGKYVAQFSKDVVKETTETIYVNGFPDMDYLLFYYDFSHTERHDLDNITILYINDEPIHAVGWRSDAACRYLGIEEGYSYNDSNRLIVHCGDNTGQGLESFYLDIKKIKEMYPNVTSIKFDTYGNWYGNKVAEDTGKPMDVYLRIIPYRGGEMTLSNYKFTNEGGEFVSETEEGYKLDPKTVTSTEAEPTHNTPEYYSRMGMYELNLETGELTCDGEAIGAMKNIKIPQTITKQESETAYSYIEGQLVDATQAKELLKQRSWTISYSLLNNSWVSFHSYLPNVYITQPNKFYTWSYDSNVIWKHNKDYHYQEFNQKRCPFIFEYVDNSNAIVTKITDTIKFKTEAKKYDADTNSFVSCRFVTFNKAVLYNSRQCSGLLEFTVKDKYPTTDYIQRQVSDTRNNVYLERNEEDWSFNNFRDIRTDYTKPIWNKSDWKEAGEYIDKTLNDRTVSINKSWMELEPFRDKYLIVRFVFDNFDDETDRYGLYKLIINYFIQQDTISIR